MIIGEVTPDREAEDQHLHLVAKWLATVSVC